jgi:hypothetical protein
MYWDRFDICAAYFTMEMDWNKGGWLPERPSNVRRNESTAVQLYRMGYKPSPLFMGYASLSENGQDIYHMLERRYSLVGEAGL